MYITAIIVIEGEHSPLLPRDYVKWHAHRTDMQTGFILTSETMQKKTLQSWARESSFYQVWTRTEAVLLPIKTRVRPEHVEKSDKCSLEYESRYYCGTSVKNKSQHLIIKFKIEDDKTGEGGKRQTWLDTCSREYNHSI